MSFGGTSSVPWYSLPADHLPLAFFKPYIRICDCDSAILSAFPHRNHDEMVKWFISFCGAHSTRSARIGSTLAARCAGITAASSAARPRMTVVATSTAGSAGRTL